MKLKTLLQIVKYIRAIDAETAINASMLSTLIEDGKLPYEKRGNRIVMDIDTVLPMLCKLLGGIQTNTVPHIRTIRSVIQEIRLNMQDLGLSEEQIRTAVRDGTVDSIRVGNRAYIAVEMFEEPYVQRFSNALFRDEDNNSCREQDSYAQMSMLLKNTAPMPKITRVRK